MRKTSVYTEENFKTMTRAEIQTPIPNTQLIIPIILVIALCLLVYRYLKEKHKYWEYRGVRCPPGPPLLGHTFSRMGLSRPFTEFFDELYYKYNGRDFCGFYDMLKPGLFIGNPELIRSVLVRDFDHFADRRTFDLEKVNPIANDMLTNARGSHWRYIRSVVSPAFTATKTRRLYPLLLTHAHAFAKLARDKAQLGHVEARELCGRFTMDTIASCAFGIECDALASDASSFPTMAARIFQLSPTRAIKMLVLAIAPKLAEMVHSLGLQFTSEEFHFFRQVVSHTLKTRRCSGMRRGDFIDMLMETGKDGKQGLSDDTMAAQSILFILAGYDNTANTLSMALHLLAHHHSVRAKLRREIAHAILKNGGILHHDTLTSLPYLDAVISEVLRLYPAAPVIERVCTKKYSMGGCGINVDVGTGVLIPVWNIHRDPHHWPHPHAFKPERFLTSTGTSGKANLSSYTYLPFGTGPRSCIGLKFAMLSVKAGLACLLSHIEVLPSQTSPYPVSLDPRVLTLQPKHGVYIHLKYINSIQLKDLISEEMCVFPPTTTNDHKIINELDVILKKSDLNFNISI